MQRQNTLNTQLIGNDTQNWDSGLNNTLQLNNETEIFDNRTQNGNGTDWYDNQLNNTSTIENGTINNDTNNGKFGLLSLACTSVHHLIEGKQTIVDISIQCTSALIF